MKDKVALSRWVEVRRAQLRAELDAYCARLYGLTCDELRYILDPQEAKMWRQLHCRQPAVQLLAKLSR